MTVRSPFANLVMAKVVCCGVLMVEDSPAFRRAADNNRHHQNSRKAKKKQADANRKHLVLALEQVSIPEYRYNVQAALTWIEHGTSRKTCASGCTLSENHTTGHAVSVLNSSWTRRARAYLDHKDGLILICVQICGENRVV